jgi:hypothetical protein
MTNSEIVTQNRAQFHENYNQQPILKLLTWKKEFSAAGFLQKSGFAK